MMAAAVLKLRTWGGIGDVLLLTPSLRAWKAAHPMGRLQVYCSSPLHFELLRHNPHIDVLRLAPQRWPGAAHLMSDAIGAFLGGPGVQRRLQRVWQRWKTTMPAYGWLFPTVTGRHAVHLTGELLGVAASHPLEVFLTPEEEATASAWMVEFETPVVIHPRTSTDENRNWPIEKWASLVARNPHVSFVQLGLAADPPIRGTVDRRGAPLRESIALVKGAAAFVGIESSLAHAAHAVGTPSVVLFGPTDPRVWAHPNSVSVSRHLRCAPCIDLLRDCPCPYGNPCMAELPVEDVEAALQRQLRARQALS
jgi:ADP-heptose:LPS heptosyltransferase